MKRTKIICTLGPACDDEKIIRDMLKAGMNAARFNFSHGSHEEHGKRIKMFRKVRDEMGACAATILDTKGPEIRTGEIEGTVLLSEGQEYSLICENIVGNAAFTGVTYRGLADEVEIGTIVLIDDGKISLQVKEIKGTEIQCIVLNGGLLSSKKGINVPGVHVDLEYLTEQDRSDILFGIKNKFNYVAASFTRNAEDVKNLREFLDNNGGENVGIISKIENAEGLQKFDDILVLSDGIMVARGDMGVEVDYSTLPGIQKAIIKKCNRLGKLVITATQMLDSMMENSMPTRAEISDVANAVFDGTSAVMLSGETAAGKYPVKTVETMSNIVKQAERDIIKNSDLSDSLIREQKLTNANDTAFAIGHAACTVADDINAKAMAAITASGYTAAMMARFRPRQPIIGVTPYDYVYHNMSILWGVDSALGLIGDDWDELAGIAGAKMKELGYADTGDYVVISAGIPLEQKGNTNMLKVEMLR